MPLRIRGAVRGVLNVDDVLPLSESPLRTQQAMGAILGLRSALEGDLAVLIA